MSVMKKDSNEGDEKIYADEDWRLVVKVEDASSLLDTHAANQYWIQETLEEGGGEGATKNTFLCEYCTKEFSSLYKLLKHTKTHTFNCETCHRPFSDDEQLARHKVTHTKKNPFT